MADVPADSPLRTAPVLLPAAPDLPQSTPLATPEVRVLLGYTRRLLHLPDGQTFGIFSFSNSAPANWLFLVDGRDLSVQRYAIPNNDIASHGGALGADGNIYVMPYGNNRVHCFNIATRTFTTTEVPISSAEYAWDAIGATNGRIYFGTYGKACLGEYDPQTGKLQLWEQIAADTKYVQDFSEDAEGRIHCRATGPASTWMVFDPRTRELGPGDPAVPTVPVRTVEPAKLPEPDDSWLGMAWVGDRRFSVSHPSGRLWEIGPEGAPRLLGETEAFGEPAFWVEALPGAVVGIGYFGVIFRYDLQTGEFRRTQMPNSAAGGNSLMFIEAVGGKWVVGANYSQQNLFRLDVDTGEVVQPPWQIARSSGEPMCALGWQDRAYLGIYTGSILMRYDAGRPFAYLQNPHDLIELREAYKQTRPRAAASDGERVYLTSDSAYNELGGALAVIDPATDAVRVYHHLIRDQNLPTVAYDPESRLLWGGTDRWGQMRSHAPTQDSSLIYAFDPAAGKVVHTLTPWPGSDVTNVVGVGPGGILMASCQSELALIDTATREVLYQGASPIALPARLCRGADGEAYCLSGGYLCRWDVARNALVPVAQSGGAVFLTEVRPGLWALADGTTIYRVQVPPRR
jgi:outer membrane protein assembly factor BamB